jgi:murein tripeptide amidase MpaA
MTINVTSAFDGGNIEVIRADDPQDICLNIEKDNASDFYQWFYFRLTGAKEEDCRMVLENAKNAAFVGGWENYRACASYDRKHWFRVETTSYENGQLIINHKPVQDSIYYAYFAPYSIERHHDRIAEYAQNEGVALRVIGHSIEGQTLDCLEIGEGDINIWVIARQHPGETMAEWWMDGFITHLIRGQDEATCTLREKAKLFIVPNMNPDGSCRGNLRTNVAGANLNREWGVATLEKSPEVVHTVEAMDENPPRLCLDVHGDEALPYNFIAGAEGIPGYTEKQAKNLADFLQAYKKSSPDFQTEKGYGLSAPGEGNLTMCTNFTAHRYDCLAMTLEMPFKDNANRPDDVVGWSPERSAELGEAVIQAMVNVLDQL